MTTQLLRIGTAVLTTLLALAALWEFRLVVVYVLLSLALAAALRPLVLRLAGQSRGVRLALILSSLVALGSFVLLLVLSIGAAVRDIQQLAQQVSVQDEWQQPTWLQGSSFQQLLDAQLPSPSQLFAALIGEEGQVVLPAVLGLTEGVFTVLGGALVVLFLSLYWSVDRKRFERLWLSLLPPGQRTRARDIWQTVESDLGSYIRSEVAQSLLAGLLLGLGYWALGSPYPALLAMAGALALLVPVIGAVLAVLPPLLLGLLTGVPLTFFTVSYTVAVITALRFWVEPRLSKRRQVNSMLTLVILIALADAYGLLGIIIAPPLSTAFQILWSRLVSRPTRATGPSQIEDLKERQERAWATIRAMDEPPPPWVFSGMERLAHLIEKAEVTVKAARRPGDVNEASKAFLADSRDG